MLYLLWSLPLLTVAVLIATGRAGSILAGTAGACLAVIVAGLAAPRHFGIGESVQAVAHGAWLAFLIGFVIAGGLFFREVLSDEPIEKGPEQGSADQRRRLFDICFLIGPFSESVTGFGVGQVSAVASIRSLGVAPLNAIVLGLFSQTLVPWGAMATGTMLGAELAGLDPHDLGFRTACISSILLVAWLCLYWRLARTAGLPANGCILATESAWILGIGAALIFANILLGPETAGIGTLGPLIILRELLRSKGVAQLWLQTRSTVIPYALLAIGLSTTRVVPLIGERLFALCRFMPISDAPAWAPLLHPGTWLIGIALGTAIVTGRQKRITIAIRRTWPLANRAIANIAVYLIISQVMAISGIATASAELLKAHLGALAVLTTPVLAGAFGLLTGSGNATNGLLMPSQRALAILTTVSLPWLAAVQNTTACALTMLSPVRVGIGCTLGGKPRHERQVYANAWPLGAVVVVLGLLITMLLLFSGTG